MVDPDLSSDEAGAGSVPGVIIEIAEFLVVLSFTPEASVAFHNSLFRPFS